MHFHAKNCMQKESVENSKKSSSSLYIRCDNENMDKVL
jgi:hypothetical protein